MLKIGNLTLKSNLILSPMAGITDLPFRLLNREFGAELAFVEMINARSLGYNSKKTRFMLSTGAQDKPLGVQLLGCEPNFILRALDILEKYEFDLLDFNSACPAKKVTRRGEGASLLKDPKKLNQLLKLVVKNSSRPVTVKIRAGWDKDSLNAKEVALYAQDAGVKALFIHGRTKAQGYSGTPDYKAIKSVKDALKIPVIASGDILSARLAKKMLDETGCNGLAVARGSLGNPWIFREIPAFLKTGKILPRPTSQEVVRIILKHLEMCASFYGERIGVTIFRKFVSWYTRGFRKIRPLREKASRAMTKSDILKLSAEFLAAN
ncbi:tRNA dihydrouridine synthase DusB [bacterium]|nr:MAG: tRNA dihydrouridine synthase DusB [bacterium]